MKKHKGSLKLRKLPAVALLVVTIGALEVFNSRSTPLILTTLYIASLAPSYAIQAENDKMENTAKAVFGFAIAIALASLVIYFVTNLIIYGL